jgi:hypothetical protein
MEHVLSVIVTVVAVLGLLAGLVAWLLKIRAEITAIDGKVEAMKAEVAQMHERCADRKQWMLEVTNTVRIIDKNQTRLAAMLGVDVLET